MSRPGLYPKSALYSKSTIISAGDREGVGSLLLHQPIKRSRELSSKAPRGVTWGELFVTSARTPPKTNLLGEEREGLILGDQWAPLPSHLVHYPGDNSEYVNITSHPPGTPVEETDSFSYLAKVPDVGWELATQVVGRW